MHKVAMAKVAEELTTMRKEVVADKLKERQDKEYVEKGRPYLGFSKRGSKVVVTGDSVRMQKLQANPEALDLIKSFFNGDNENVELKFEKDEEIYIPPFFCPVGDVQNGYHHSGRPSQHSGQRQGGGIKNGKQRKKSKSSPLVHQ